MNIFWNASFQQIFAAKETKMMLLLFPIHGVPQVVQFKLTASN